MGFNGYDLLGQLGLGGLFIGSIIEALGLPFPGSIMLVLAGVLINKGQMEYTGALALAVAGFNFGASIAYITGKTVGEQFLDKFQKFFKIDKQKLKRSQEWLKHSAGAFILLGRFVPMASNITPYLAGISGLKATKFLFYNIIFALLWSNLYLAIGYFFSQSFRLVMGYTQKYIPYAAGGIFIIYLVLAYILKRKGSKLNQRP